MGLRYEQALVSQLLEGGVAMEESVTYQAMLARGALQEARKILLLLGRKQFGVPGPRIRAAVEGIADLERLEHLQVRLLKVRSWEELLGLPRRATSKRKRKS